MSLSLRARRLVWAGLILAGPVAACSAKSSTYPVGNINPGTPEENETSDGGGGSSGSASGITTSGSSGSNTGTPGIFVPMEAAAPIMTAPLTRDAACDFSTMSGQQQALNAYMMLDYSASMQMQGKWTGITAAINSFVDQPTSGISVGLQYFSQPKPDAGVLAGLIPGTDDSCDPAAYAKPAIEIQPLPGVASAITASLAKHTNPNTGTPTAPALQGAIDHATVWAKAHPGDATVVILATDGDPDDCPVGATVADVQAVAAAGVAQTPKILTFVIGVGSSLTNLNDIAMSGGTGSAFIVDTSMNISAQFLAALNKIRAAALGCQYRIPVPDSGTVNFKQINVQFTPSGGSSEFVPQVPDKSKCPTMGDAWYYDNPSSPSEILLCSTTCGTVATGGTVNVLTGCDTVTVIPPPTK
jgi:hypothetical protein